MSDDRPLPALVTRPFAPAEPVNGLDGVWDLCRYLDRRANDAIKAGPPRDRSEP